MKNNNNNYEESFESDRFITPDSMSDSSSLRDLVLSSLFASKPMGIIWEKDIQEDLLKNVGYKIIERYSSDRDEYYKVAVKEDSEVIPEEDFSNIPRMFDLEVQKLILKWLLSFK